MIVEGKKWENTERNYKKIYIQETKRKKTIHNMLIIVNVKGTEECRIQWRQEKENLYNTLIFSVCDITSQTGR